jgi:hypothetical protein
MNPIILIAVLVQTIVAAAGMSPAPGTIPPPELRTLVDRLSFLAALGQRCNARLETAGRAALGSRDCAEFERKVLTFMQTEMEQAKPALRAAARAADQAVTRTEQVEWEFFFHDFYRHYGAVEKALEHLKFLREP